MSEKIVKTDSGLQVPNQPIVPFIIGDGIGPDIWKAASRVIDLAMKKLMPVRKKLTGKKY